MLDALSTDDRFYQIFSAASNAFAFTDADSGRIIDVNPRWIEMAGIPRHRAIGHSAQELGLWTDLADRAAVLTELAATGRVRERLVRLRMGRVTEPDAQRVQPQLFALNATRIESPSGRYILWEFRDHSELARSQAEEEALRGQLQRAQRLDSIGRLAGGVAHDFNNHLSVILSLSELLRDQIGDGPAAEDLTQIRMAAQRASDLTRQLLTFAQRQLLQPEVLDLNDNVKTLLRLLRRVSGDNVTLDSALAAGIWTVRADPVQVDQVLMNFAVNGLHAMGGSGRLTITTENRTLSAADVSGDRTAGDYVVTSVIDTGVGMDAEVLRHIFEPFFTTKPQGDGTGLGLSTAWGIATKHGGFIDVESAVGQGSRFSLWLPRTDQRVERLAPLTTAGSKGGGEHVLLVEDDAMLRNVSSRALRTAGYRVTEAVGGEVALRMAHEADPPIDVTITDVSMPGMNGFELARHLRELHPTMPILLTSGYAEQSAPLAEGQTFLPKPYVPSALTRALRTLLDARNPAPE